MRIVVTDIAASSSGALSILTDFYNYLTSKNDENEWFFLLSDYYIKEKENIKVIILKDVKKSWLRRLKFEFLDAKKYINELKPDVVFSLQNILPREIKCQAVLYIHQPLPYQTIKRFSFFKKEERIYAVYQYIIGLLIRSSAKKADKIIVQTQWIKSEIAKQDGVNPDKIECIPPSINISNHSKLNLSNKKFFYPASNIVYKNHKCIIEACNILNKNGIDDFAVKFTLDNTDTKNIKYIGSVTRDEVFNHYAEGTLIFPSYIESFGYPLLEARTVGTLILAADCEFAHELLNGYENAYFFDPFDPSQLAALMEKIMNGDIKCKPCDTSYVNTNDGWGKVCDIILNEGLA